MDRRLRSPPRPRAAAAPRAADRLRASPHRFLRPGALARLRDSRIVARSLRRSAAARVPPSPPRPASPAAAVVVGADDAVVAHFLGVAPRGAMRYPLRKKLAAARAVVFLPPQLQPEVLVAAAFAPADLAAAAH
ncbi:hypothetical protein ACP4OV_013877 [Aristida adscensionis]